MYKIVLTAVAVATLSGCASTPHPGLVEGTPVPRIVKGKHEVPMWTNIPSFGRIKAGDEAHAQTVCATLDDQKHVYRAEGYHTQALNVDGEKFAGGGYYCVAHKRR